MNALIEARKRQLEARDAYEGATRALVEVLKEERGRGATMDTLAEALGVTRQYVHKMLKG